MRNVFLWALYPVAAACLFVLRVVPVRLGYAFCDTVAALAYRVDRRRRERGRRNVRAAFPARSPAAHAALVKGSYRNLVRVGYEVMCMGRLLSPATVEELVAVEGLEHVAAARAAGNGVVFMTAHVGNWEVFGVAMGLNGYPLNSVARGVESGPFDRLLRGWREVHGQQILSFQGAVKEGRRMVKAGLNLAFVADQHARVSRLWIPFFGRPAAWIKTPASLARRLGVPVIVGFCRRVGPGFRFRGTLLPPILPDPDLPAREDVARMTGLYARHLEAYIRDHPEDYLWLHRRWRTPRDGEELWRGDGTYVRHATFGAPGSHADQAATARHPLQSRPPGPAR